MKKIQVLLLASFAFFASCSKDDKTEDTTTPPVTNEAADKLQADISTKWTLDPEVIETLLPKYEVPAPVTNSILFRKKERLDDHLETNEPNPGQGEPNLTFVEFFGDSSYVVSYHGSIVLSGKFKAMSGDSIVLTNLGSIGGIKIANNRLECRLHYTALSKTIIITGLKAATVAENSKNALFFRTYYIAREENFEEALGDDMDSITVRFSNTGSYLVQGFYNKQLIEASVMQWKWHASDASKFLYFSEEDYFDPGEVVIREITENVLKISEFYNADDEPGDEEIKFTLRPIK